MPLLTVSNACLSYGLVPLLDRASFGLDMGERVALLGRNGSGKSSFLKAIVGQQALDEGEIWLAPNTKIGYVSQEPVFEAGHTVMQAVMLGMREEMGQLMAYEQLATELTELETQPQHVDNAQTKAKQHALIQQLHDLQLVLEHSSAWTIKTRAEAIISKMKVPPHARVDSLSGGQKKRVALARAQMGDPSILLLDEPTNHLDFEAIEWLESWLNGLSIGVLFITHDRRFLDRVATRVVELDRGHLGDFPGRFVDYQRKKELLLEEEAVRQRKEDKQLAQEELWIRQGVEARRTRSVFRVERLQKLRAERAARLMHQGGVSFAVDVGEKSGHLVAELTNVCKAFQAPGGHSPKTVVKNFSCRIKRGDKIGIIGENGAGKSTLLSLILGALKPDSGTVKLGTKLNIAYFDQFRETLDDNLSLAEMISPGSEFIQIGNRKTHVIGYLGDFLFSPQRAYSKVSSLSGGERNRLLLARLFAKPSNVLVLDEPTNDLDLETLELLESLLQEYDGTVLLVSHDRAFLDSVVTHIIAPVNIGLSTSEAQRGEWFETVGGYDDYANYLKGKIKQKTTIKTEDTRAQKTDNQNIAPMSNAMSNTISNVLTPAKLKLSYHEQRELSAMPEKVAQLEAEQAALTQKMSDSVVFSNHLEAAAITLRIAEIEETLMCLLERWSSLESIKK